MTKKTIHNKKIPSTYNEVYEYFFKELTQVLIIEKEDEDAGDFCGILRIEGETPDFHRGKAEALANILDIPQREINKLMKNIKKVLKWKKRWLKQIKKT